jgi:hypothetical protein
VNAAYLCGKVGEEDQLTSDIFGLLRYLPPNLILWPFLKLARCFIKSDSVGMDEEVGFCPTLSDYFFWPAANLPATPGNRALDRQPDLLILLTDSEKHSAAIVVEIKLSSIKHDVDARITNELDEKYQCTSELGSKLKLPESDEMYGDQLADYFRALRDNGITFPIRGSRSAKIEAMVANESWDAQKKLSAVPIDKKFLLYLTDAYSPPDREIADTLSRFGQASRSSAGSKLFWLGWSSLYLVVENELSSPSSATSSNEAFRKILSDILRLMDARDVREFSGWDKILMSNANPSDLCFWTPRWFSDVAGLDTRISESINFWKTH